MQSVEWRPDGTRLSYLGWETLFDLKPDGTDRRALLPVDKYYGAQGWSPDGRYLALSIGRANMHTWAAGVGLLPRDGGDVKYLDILGRTAWSPNGRQLAYTETGSFFDSFPPAEGSTAAGLYAIDVETGRQARLTHSGSARDDDPEWFPDGRRLAFLRDRRDGLGDLYLLAVNDGRLIRYATGVKEFAISPTGSRLAWVTERGLFADSLDGSSNTRLTSQDAQALTWSPDGTQIAYSGWDSTRRQRDIYTVAIQERRVRRVTMTAADERAVTWRPN